MAELKRHIGRLSNSDRRCVVIYMQIPNRETHALIVDTDALPDSVHQFFMGIVESKTAQETVNLADVLDRRASPDAGLNMMNSLHQRGLLRPEPISNIIMMPRPNMPYPLTKILEDSGKLNKPSLNQQAAPPVQELGRYNQYTENMKIENYEANMAIAKNHLANARMLQEEVNRTLAKAYSMAPTLDPNYIPPESSRQQASPLAFVDNQDYMQESRDTREFNYSDNNQLNSDGLSSQEAAEFQRIAAKAQEHLDKMAAEEAEKNKATSSEVINLTEQTKPQTKKITSKITKKPVIK